MLLLPLKIKMNSRHVQPATGLDRATRKIRFLGKCCHFWIKSIWESRLLAWNKSSALKRMICTSTSPTTTPKEDGPAPLPRFTNHEVSQENSVYPLRLTASFVGPFTAYKKSCRCRLLARAITDPPAHPRELRGEVTHANQWRNSAPISCSKISNHL